MGEFEEIKKDFEGRKEFNQAWGAMTRKIHMFNLAKPSPRRLKPYPDPTYFVEIPREIPKEALKYVATERIKLMSNQKEVKKSPKWTKPPEKETTVEKAALLHTPSPRLIELSIPPEKKEKKIGEPDEGAQARKVKLKKSIKHRDAWLATRATPKQYPPKEHIHKVRPRFIMKGKKRVVIKGTKKYAPPAVKTPLEATSSEIMMRVQQLAIPNKKREKYKFVLPPDDFNKKRQRHLAEELSPTIQTLCRPKTIPEEALRDLKYNPFKIPKAALLYRATARINTLAMPYVRRKRKLSDLKENPFAVSPRALKAVASKRIHELARPIPRG